MRVLLLPLLLLVFADELAANFSFVRDCSDTPNKDIHQTCLMLYKMDSMTRRRVKKQSAPQWQIPIPIPANARGQSAYHPYDCMTLQCLCPFFGGSMQGGNCILSNGAPLAMAYRKEYRVMTDDERQRWHAALTTLKRNGEYDRISAEHLGVGVASGAHSGPGFLPWHREYLKRFEIALRLVDPSVSIPYWDSVMDQYLPDPRDSVMFSNDFAGETDGYGNVIFGPFAYWPTLEGRGNILRQGQLFTENQINVVASQSNIEYVLAYTAPGAACGYPNNYGAIEYIHSNIHLFIGGDMKPPTTSANEPIFFMHHSFVDYLWELWRQLRQPRWYREVAYSADDPLCANPMHFSYADMRPFPYLRNSDGLSNSYTDQMYRYAPRPTCTAATPNCGSRWLFCDTRGFPHCVAKVCSRVFHSPSQVKYGGICRGFESYDVCASGRCWYGRCVSSPARMRAAKTVWEMPRAIALEPLKKKAELFVDCYNRNPCCDSWALGGLCNRRPEYMGVYCAAACTACTPAFNRTNECSDRHLNCGAWSLLGMCKGDSKKFMAENCRHSCGLCDAHKADECHLAGKLLSIPMEESLEVKTAGEDLDVTSRRRVRAAASSSVVKIRALEKPVL